MKDDTISRQAAIKAAIKADMENHNGILSEKRARVLEEHIAILPPVQPKRIEGAWINEGRIIRCDKCKIGYATVKGMKSALTYNFCPNCGADMRGEQDG